jgi:transposase
MAKSQQNSTITLLGLKDCKAEEVVRDDDRVTVKIMINGGREKCPYCGSAKLYGHGMCDPRHVLHTWTNGTKVYLDLHRQRWRCRGCGHTFTEGKQLVRSRSRLTRQAEAEALWQLKERNFSQVTRELGVGYGTLRRLMEREIDEEALGFIQHEDEIHLGIDEHSFKHQEMVYTVTEVRAKRVLGILKDDRIATLKNFLTKIPGHRVREVCIDMKESLRKLVEALYPEAKVVADHFHVIADSNRRMDEARRIEQDVRWKRKIQIPKKIFLIGGEKLSEQARQKLNGLLEKYPSLKGFYWAKEKVRELYRQGSKEEAAKILDNIILNLKCEDDGELIRWGNNLKHWREPILNYFDKRTTNGFTEGCHTKIKMLKRVSYGLRNVDVYWRKMLLGFVPSRSCFHSI